VKAYTNKKEIIQGTSQDNYHDPSQPLLNPNELWVKAYTNKKDRIHGIGNETVNIRESPYFSPSLEQVY